MSGRFGADAGKHVRAGRGRDQFAYFADFASPGQVDDLCVGQQVCGGGGDGAVQALRSQRSASDQHQRTVRIDAKLRGRFTAYGGTIVTDAFGQGGDGRAQRQTDTLDVGSGTRFETGAFVHGTDEIGPTSAQFIGHAGTRILLMDGNRNAHLVCGGVDGGGSIPAESGYDIRMPRFKNGAHLGGFSLPFCREAKHVQVRATRERHFFDGVELVAGLRHQILLQTHRSADDGDLCRGFDVANRSGDREQRIDMSGGTAASKNDMWCALIHDYRVYLRALTRLFYLRLRTHKSHNQSGRRQAHDH